MSGVVAVCQCVFICQLFVSVCLFVSCLSVCVCLSTVCQCVFVCQLFVSSAVCIWARRDRCGSVTPLYSPCSPMEGMREPSMTEWTNGRGMVEAAMSEEHYHTCVEYNIDDWDTSSPV